MAVTKPYEFIGFGAMAVTKPYEFIGFGAMAALIEANFGEGKPKVHAFKVSPRSLLLAPLLRGLGKP